MSRERRSHVKGDDGVYKYGKNSKTANSVTSGSGCSGVDIPNMVRVSTSHTILNIFTAPTSCRKMPRAPDGILLRTRL